MPSSGRTPDTRKAVKPARRVALDASLLAFALMLSYLEHAIPFASFLPIPYFKLGLANVVVLLAFSCLSPFDALVISILRVGITGVLFGSWTSLFFSACGATLTYLSLLLSMHLLRNCSYLGISVLGAVSHNVGQTLASGIVTGVSSLPSLMAVYLPFLLPAGIVMGTVTGLLLNLSVPRTERWFKP